MSSQVFSLQTCKVKWNYFLSVVFIHSDVKSVWCVTASQPLQGQIEVWILVASITLCFIPCLRLCYIMYSEWTNFMFFWCCYYFYSRIQHTWYPYHWPKKLRFKLLDNKLLVLFTVTGRILYTDLAVPYVYSSQF